MNYLRTLIDLTGDKLITKRLFYSATQTKYTRSESQNLGWLIELSKLPLNCLINSTLCMLVFQEHTLLAYMPSYQKNGKNIPSFLRSPKNLTPDSKPEKILLVLMQAALRAFRKKLPRVQAIWMFSSCGTK